MPTTCDCQAATSPGPSKHDKRPIVLISESLDPARGGAELYLGHLARFLAQNGHPVHVYVRRRSPQAGEFFSDGVRVEVVPTMRRFRVVWERPFARRVARRLDGHADIVLSTLPVPGITHYQPHSGLYRSAFEATRRSMDPGMAREFYFLGHGLNLRRQSLMRMQEQLLNSARPPRIMTFSNHVRAQILGAHPSLSSSVATVPLGVDLARFHPGKEKQNAWSAHRETSRLTLLFVAQNFRLKGLSCLLAALGESLRQGLAADLLVVGKRSGANRSFPALARRLGLEPAVRFLGTVPDLQMPSLYRSCDALVHPTFSDHCSLAVLEALACGLPVITTRQNGAAELIEQGREGLILDRPDDIGALAAALLSLQDARKLSEMSAEAALLRPQIDFEFHARRVADWLTAPGAPPATLTRASAMQPEG